MLKKSTLSRKPVTRNFAVDLRMPHMEIVEFAWMDDGCLIIACRRLQESGSFDKRLVLNADMMFYDVIPRHSAPDVPLLRMTVLEKAAICQFCGVRGIDSCLCPSTFKRSVPSNASTTDSNKQQNRRLPKGLSPSRISTWSNYTKQIFSCAQSGSFFVHWYKRSEQGMKLFISHPHPISYQFVCGKRKDTLRLASLYVQKMKFCQHAIAADTRFYGSLSKGSDIGMLMDKDEEYEHTPMTADQLLGIKPINPFEEMQEFSTTAASTRSQETISSDDYQQLVGTFDPLSSSPTAILDQPVLVTQVDMGLDNVSVLSTRISGDSPTSSQQDANVACMNGTAKGTSQKSRHVMDTAYDAWGENQPAQQTTPPKLTLSTTSRQLQQYMATDASGVPTCNECGASFPKRGNLARHVQTVHLKLKPFQCEICFARFGYKNHLKRHQVVHQRGNEFRCNVCNRDFRGQSQLSKHVQQVHQQQGNNDSQTNEKIMCEVCGGKLCLQNCTTKSVEAHALIIFL